MNVLHIANYYTGSKVYQNLFSALDDKGVQQNVYTAFIGEHLRDTNNINFKTKNSSITYRAILNTYTRINYFHKLKKLTRDVQQQRDIHNAEIVHAHTVFSDGGIALNFKKKYGIPYIVAVRSTDVYFFFRFFFYLRPLGIEILKEAETIIFLNPDLQNELYQKHVPVHIASKLIQKSVCIPNGINSFWFQNIGQPKTITKNTCHILYVGSFLPRKNVPLIIEAAAQLSKTLDVSLTIIGGGGKDTKKILKAAEQLKKTAKVNIMGKINDMEQLKEYFRTADIFVMPSRNETFGLVYIESLSQGTPIIYTKNTGIGGYFHDGEVGYGITDFSAKNIAEKIKLTLLNYDIISKKAVQCIKRFNWPSIAGEYLGIYQSCLHRKSAVNCADN